MNLLLMLTMQVILGVNIGQATHRNQWEHATKLSFRLGVLISLYYAIPDVGLSSLLLQNTVIFMLNVHHKCISLLEYITYSDFWLEVT